MWYVNIFRATGGSAGATGFILTMWYVNPSMTSGLTYPAIVLY